MLIERKGHTYKLVFTSTTSQIELQRLRHHGPRKWVQHLAIKHQAQAIEVGQATAQALFNALLADGRITQESISDYGTADDPHWAAVVRGV